MGVNDYLTRPIDRNELLARVRTQIRRKRHSDHLRGPPGGERRARRDRSRSPACTTAATWRRTSRRWRSRREAGGRPLSVLLADIDNFKSINDTYGHDAGDNVLREFAARFRRNTRGIDLACRLGGEEFVIVMPDTGLERACQIGERLRECIAAEPFQTPIGAASLDGDGQRRRSPTLERPHDTAGGAVQARRPGALRGQARRPQPGGGRRGVTVAVAVASYCWNTYY